MTNQIPENGLSADDSGAAVLDEAAQLEDALSDIVVSSTVLTWE
jgi:hypothetical protein